MKTETSSFSLCRPLWHLCFVDFHEEDRTTAWCHKDSIKHLAYYPTHFCVCLELLKMSLVCIELWHQPTKESIRRPLFQRRAAWWIVQSTSDPNAAKVYGLRCMVLSVIRRKASSTFSHVFCVELALKWQLAYFFCGSGTAGSFQQDFASLCCTTFSLTGSEKSNHWRTLMVVIYSSHGQIYDELKMPFLAFSYMGHRLPLCKI